MYKLFGYGFRPLDSSNAPYNKSGIENIPSENRSGYWFTITPTIKLKMFSVIIANSLNFNIFNMGDEGYFLEMRSYSIRKTQDTDIRNYVYLLYKINEKWIVGANYYYLYVVNSAYTSHRICGVVLFTPKTKSLYNANAGFTAGVYLKDRYLKYLPYIGLKFSLELKIR